MEKEQPRRTFLTWLTGGIVGLGALFAGWPLFRSLAPNVLYEPPKRMRVGAPDRFQEGVTYLEKERLYVFKEGNSFHCISAVCTHLGCTVKYAPYKRKEVQTVRKLEFTSGGEFHCPCHGSKFYGDGTNYSGPAPRPLAWHPLDVSAADGQLVVDLGQRVERDFRLVV
jgi:menaquinol-cytochrome c reductase iron-sulfur subunit